MRHPAIVIWYPSAVSHSTRMKTFGNESDHDDKRFVGPTLVDSDFHERGNGRKIFFRFANIFSPVFDRASQPIRIIISWKYHSSAGLPGSEEHRQMIQFEEVLGPVLDQGGFATLALVSPGEDLRGWIYYAQSEGEFAARFDYAFAGRFSTCPLKSTLPTIRNGEPMRNLEQEFGEGDGSSS